ncbi:MAG: PKD domain-containing protein [Planctomycetota bacterium]
MALFDEGGNLAQVLPFSDNIGTPVDCVADPANGHLVFTVYDARGKSAQQSVLVSPGNTPPEVAILSPSDGSFFHVGDTIGLEGSAQDGEDDAAGIPLNALWNVNLVHDHHVHPNYYELPWLSASFIADSHGPGTYYEVELVVTDSRSLTTTQAIRLYDAEAIPKAHIVGVSHENPHVGLEFSAKGHAEYAGKETLNLTWDWGDGSPPEVFYDVTHQQDTEPRHTYQDPDSYDVTLTAEDDGQETQHVLTITVGPLRPAVAIFHPVVAERWVLEEEQEAIAQDLSRFLDRAAHRRWRGGSVAGPLTCGRRASCRCSPSR